MSEIYKYYHYPSGREFYLNKRINDPVALVKIMIRQGIETETLYEEWENCEIDADESLQTGDKRLIFNFKKFYKWLSISSLKAVIEAEEIEVTKIKVINLI